MLVKQPFAHFCICSLPVRPGGASFPFITLHSNNIFIFLLTLCIFRTPTDDEIAVHSLEKRSQSKFCKNRASCCLWKWTYSGLCINTLLWGPVSSLQNVLRGHLQLPGLLVWPPKGTTGPPLLLLQRFHIDLFSRNKYRFFLFFSLI